jgi:hypothetical protein
VESQKDSDRVYRFIESFEKLYGRKPIQKDAEADFKIRVAQDMQMSLGGARYYLRLATKYEKHEKEENWLSFDEI